MSCCARRVSPSSSFQRQQERRSTYLGSWQSLRMRFGGAIPRFTPVQLSPSPDNQADHTAQGYSSGRLPMHPERLPQTVDQSNWVCTLASMRKCRFGRSAEWQ
jgi:hypothetical protein